MRGDYLACLTERWACVIGAANFKFWINYLKTQRKALES